MRLTFALIFMLGCGGNDASEPEPEPVTTGAEAETTPADDAATYADDIELICNRSLQESGFADATPENKATVLARYIDENLQTEQGRNLFSGLAQLSPEEKAETLSNEARDNGVTECALVQVWAEPEPAP